MHIFGQKFISISLALSQKNEVEKRPLITSFQCINDIPTYIEPENRLFVDDCVCYREINEKQDTVKLQNDTERLEAKARK